MGKYIFLFVVIFIQSFSPKAKAEGRVVDFDRLNKKNGLSHNRTDAILKDSKGFMWFGTLEGLCRYDGSKMTVFRNDSSNNYSISDNKISSLFEDRDSTLWIGTGNGGLNQYNAKTGSFTHFLFNKGTTNLYNIRSISSDGDGFLWIGMYGGGLSRFDKRNGDIVSFKHDIKDPNSISSDDIYSVLSDGQKVWVATSGRGLDVLDKKTGLFKHYLQTFKEGSISDNAVFFVFKDSKKRIWIGTDFGLNRYDAIHDCFINYGRQPNNPNSLCDNQILSISEDKFGRLWIATKNGLSCLSNPTTSRESFTNYYHDNRDRISISGDNLLCVFVDNSNILWVGTFSAGVNKAILEEQPFLIYNHQEKNPKSISQNVIRAIYDDRDGNLWVGTDGGGVNLMRKGTNDFARFQTSSDVRSINHNHILSIQQDQFGDMWFGTWGGGLNRLNYKDINSANPKFIHYRKSPSCPKNIADNIIKDIFEDKEGRLWIGTEDGLSLFDRKKDRLISFSEYGNSNNTLSDNRIQSNAIFQDSQGAIWVGTWEGLNKMIENRGATAVTIEGITVGPHSIGFKHFLHTPDNPNTISDNRIISITEDSKKDLWIGTYGCGINRYDRATNIFSHLNEKDGLANDVVYSIIEDNNQKLWMSTNNGLSCLSLKTLKFRNFEENDGLQSNYFYWGAAFKRKNGDLIFGGSNGFNIFNPSKIKENVFVPPIYISALLINNKTVEYAKKGSPLKVPIWRTKEIELPYGKDLLTIEFVALNYIHPEKNNYAYKLEGFNDLWINIGSDKSATYSNLSPGEYYFRVKGSNNDGVWNQVGTSLKITITPPIYGTWWFIVLMVLIGIGILWLFYFLRTRSMKIKAEILKKMVNEQTRELNEANSSLFTVNTELSEVNTLLEESNEELEMHRNHLEDLVADRTEELISAKVKAEESERLKAAFLANMSHEIRTPLNAIVGFSSLLTMDDNTPLEIEEFNFQIVQSTESLLVLIDDILDLSIIEAKQAQCKEKLFNITLFLEHFFKYWHTQHHMQHREIVLRNKVLNPDLMFFTDEHKLKQIINNLMINACKFTEKGSIELGFELQDGVYIFYVKDTGIGIAPKNLNIIFDYFRKVEDDNSKLYRGTGLGLAISKSLAELLGGKMRVESTLGIGSTFYLSIPESAVIQPQ